MIKTDRKIKNKILQLAPDMNDEIHYNPFECRLEIMKGYHEVSRSIPLEVEPQLVEESLQRLIDAGYLRVTFSFMGGYIFSITSRFVLRREFFWDNFTQKFTYGFITGVSTTVIAELLVAFFQATLGI